MVNPQRPRRLARHDRLRLARLDPQQVAAVIASLALLAALNQSVNALPRVTQAIPFSAEGKPFYDCKGAVLLKLKTLEQMGEPDSAMTILIVDNGTSTSSHAVLQVDQVILDNLDPYLERPGSYRVKIVLTPDKFKEFMRGN